jgi:hypothetical protein
VIVRVKNAHGESWVSVVPKKVRLGRAFKCRRYFTPVSDDTDFWGATCGDYSCLVVDTKGVHFHN